MANNANMMEARRAWESVIDPALRGAGSGALLDIPEWVAKQVDREATEKYIKEHEGAYRGGQLAGTVAGSFIPVGGLAAKGLQALGKGAQAGSLLAKAANLAKVPAGLSAGQALARGALTGAASGALESGVRAAAGERDILSEATQGGAFGGLAGGLGAGLKRGSEWLKEGQEAAMKAQTGEVGITKGLLKKFYQRNLPTASGGRVLEDLTDRDLPLISKKIEEWNLIPDVGRDDRIKSVYRDLSGKYKQIDKFAEENKDQLKAMLPDLGQVKDDILSSYGPELGDDGRKMLETQLNSIMKEADLNKSLPDIRKFLEEKIDQSFKRSTASSQAAGEMAKTLRTALDEAVDSLVTASGNPGFKELSQDWKAYRILSDAVKMDEFGSMAAKSGGSPTWEKAMVGGALGLGGSGISGDLADPDKLGENIGKIALGSVAGAALPKLAQGLSRGTLARQAKVFDTLAENEKLAELMPKIGESIAGLRAPASAIPAVNQRVGEIGKTMEPETVEPDRGITPYKQALYQQLYPVFQAQGGTNPEDFKKFAEYVQTQMPPQELVKRLLPKEEQKDALASIEKNKALELISQAGLGGINGAMARDAISKAVTGGLAGESKKILDKEVQKILKANIPDSKKKETLRGLLIQTDPIYNKAYSMGVI